MRPIEHDRVVLGLEQATVCIQLVPKSVRRTNLDQAHGNGIGFATSSMSTPPQRTRLEAVGLPGQSREIEQSRVSFGGQLTDAEINDLVTIGGRRPAAAPELDDLERQGVGP